jgi:hypothetical protein
MQWSRLFRSAEFVSALVAGILATIIGEIIVDDREEIWGGIKWLVIGCCGCASSVARRCGQWLVMPVTLAHFHLLALLLLTAFISLAAVLTVIRRTPKSVPALARSAVFHNRPRRR